MKLTVLGCSGPFPAANGACSGYLLWEGDTRLVMDLGSGTLGRLTALTEPAWLTGMLFSHWHADHCSDVLPLMYRLQSLKKTLDIYGPMDQNSPVLKAVLESPVFRWHELRPGDEFLLGGLTVSVWEARHPCPALMYRIAGEKSVFCYTGDTNTVPWLKEFARDADLLLADGLFPEDVWREDLPHLSAALAAETAREANTKKIMITHLNPCFDPEVLIREAWKKHPGALLARPGESVAL